MAKAALPHQTSASSSSAVESPASFEQALRELEAIVQAMESGSAPLEESLMAYERGMALLGQCQDILSAAEQKLQILENGMLRDFDVAEEAVSAEGR
jgi:exodeoxyribonuclease VII small subunit